jgi:hypothetical protein
MEPDEMAYLALLSACSHVRWPCGGVPAGCTSLRCGAGTEGEAERGEH